MNKRQNDKIVRAAARGAKWLDKRLPGWSRKVKRRKVRMEDDCGCILGQIGGSFSTMVDELDLDLDQTIRYGFMLDDDMRPLDEPWKDLTDAWRDELKSRPR